MILTTILAGVEGALNRLLPMDAEVLDELASLSPKCVKIHLSDLDLTFYARIKARRVLLSQHYDDECDATITGSSVQLLKNYTQGFSVGSGVEVTGDVEFAEHLNSLMSKYRIDWEELLAHVVGDIAAHKIHGAVTDLFAWGKDAGQRLTMDVSEFVHEEVRLSPSKEELEDFFADVATVRDAVERAQARMDLLMKEQS